MASGSTDCVFAIYHPSVYAGFWRRLAIFVIDSLVLAIAGSLVGGALLLFAVAVDAPTYFLLLIFAAEVVAAVLYLAVLKRSPTRTLGYRLADCKVVAADGGTPCFRVMTTRAILWFLVDPFLNLVAISQHENRQAISDMIAGTIVVRSHARPIRMAKRRWGYYFFMRDTYLVSRAER